MFHLLPVLAVSDIFSDFSAVFNSWFVTVCLQLYNEELFDLLDVTKDHADKVHMRLISSSESYQSCFSFHFLFTYLALQKWTQVHHLTAVSHMKLY